MRNINGLWWKAESIQPNIRNVDIKEDNVAELEIKEKSFPQEITPMLKTADKKKYFKEYYLKNKEKIKAQSSAYYKAHPENKQKWNRKWREAKEAKAEEAKENGN